MVLNLHQVRLGLILFILLGGCRSKHPTESVLLHPPTSKPIGTIQARENLLKALMASHAESWTDAEQHFHEAYQSDSHPTIVQLHTQVQQASKSLREMKEDQ